MFKQAVLILSIKHIRPTSRPSAKSRQKLLLPRGIGNPVNYLKAIKVIEYTDGVVSEVSEEEILEAKIDDDSSGIGCEPASACSVAGLKKLKKEGVIKNEESVVCILTGNMLKDPEISDGTSFRVFCKKLILIMNQLRIFFSNFI